MKDIVITGKAIKREGLVLAGCLVLAICVNVLAIIKYSRPAIELLSMIGYVFVVAVAIYFCLLTLRLVIWGLAKLIARVKS